MNKGFEDISPKSYNWPISTQKVAQHRNTSQNQWDISHPLGWLFKTKNYKREWE